MSPGIGLRINDVTFGYWRLPPAASEDATQSALYLVVRGNCTVTAAGIEPLSLSSGDMGIVTVKERHRLSVSTAGAAHRPIDAELFWFRFSDLSETFAPAASGRGAVSLCTSNSRAAAWLWRIAPLVTVSPPDGRHASTIACARLVEAILHQALDDLAGTQQGRSPRAQIDVDVTRVVELMRTQPEHRWTIDTLAREVSISRSSLANRFVQALGQPPMEYLHQLRMERAALLLDQPENEIKRIAAAVGYRSIAAFSHAFRRWSGCSPNAYRRMTNTISAK